MLKIHCISDFAQLENHWKRLAAAGNATVFQTWEWSAAWWRHNQRGKKLMALLCEETGELGAGVIGLAPFYRTAGVLRLVGTGGSDYLDFLALPGHETGVAIMVAEWLQSNPYRWLWADLQQIAPGSTARHLTGTQQWPGETCPYLPLPTTYGAFLQTRNKKLRQNIGYYERSMEKQHALEIRLASHKSFKADIRAFFELHQLRWRGRWMPGAFASQAARAFHTEAAWALLESGNLRLHTLRLDGKAVASLYCFHKARTTYYYLSGFDPKVSKLSPGTVLTANAIQHAIEADGATTFDFLRGDEGYKYKWGAQDRYNKRLSLAQPGQPLSQLLATSGRLALSLELKLKHAMHARQGGVHSPAGKEKSPEKTEQRQGNEVF